MPRFNLPDGRWLRMRLPTVNEHLAIADLPDITKLPREEQPAAKVERLRFFRDTFRSATEETSWGGDVGELPVRTLSALITPWLRAAEDDAVPPDSGSNSPTSQDEPRSPAPTDDLPTLAGQPFSQS